MLPVVVELCVDNDMTGTCSSFLLACLTTFYYAGPRCQFIDQCYSNPCYGAATCMTNPYGKYNCYCPKGWSGKNCSTDIDDCMSSILSPCHHGGTCVNTPGSFVCQCVPGYTGNYHIRSYMQGYSQTSTGQAEALASVIFLLVVVFLRGKVKHC